MEGQQLPIVLSNGNTQVSYQALIPILICFGFFAMYTVHEFTKK